MNSLLAAILNSIWQAAAVAAFAWAILRFSPKMNAATRHAVWWAVLAAVMVLPVAQPLMRRSMRAVESFEDPAPAPRASFTGPVAPRPSMPPAAPIELSPSVWPVLLPAVWMVALLFQTMRVMRSYVYVRALKRDASPASPEVQRNFETWLQSCRIARPARLLVSDRIVSPLAAGFVRPAVILPESLLAQFREDELDHVLLHELAHLARRDDWTNLAARLAGALVALHPVAAWILRRIDRERELACDDWVVSQTGAARPYAASLARLFEVCWTRRRVLLASGMADGGSNLGERIEELLRRKEFAPRASAMKVGATALVLAGLALMAAGTRPWIAFARPAARAPRPEAPRRVTLAQATMPRKSAPRAVAAPAEAPEPPRGGFLAALVAAGYDDLDVDQIIALKNSGMNGEYLLQMRKSGWGKLPPRDLIELRNRGVSPAFAGDMLDAGVKDLTIANLVALHDHGVKPEFVLETHALGFGRYTSGELIELSSRGIRPDLLRALKEAGFQGARISDIVAARDANLRASDLRTAREFGSTLTLPQIVKLKHSGVLQ